MYSIDISIHKSRILFPYLYIFTGIETGIEGFRQNTTVIFSVDQPYERILFFLFIIFQYSLSFQVMSMYKFHHQKKTRLK